MLSESRTLAKVAVDYFPQETSDGFKDNLDEYSATLFKTTGVKCSCSGKTYHNKYTFKHQHCKSKAHRKMLEDLKNVKPNVIESCVEKMNEIKSLKIYIGKVDQENFQLKQKMKEMENRIKILEEQNSELTLCVSQEEEHINKLVNNNKKIEQRNAKIEGLTKEIMKHFGYRIED